MKIGLPLFEEVLQQGTLSRDADLFVIAGTNFSSLEDLVKVG